MQEAEAEDKEEENEPPPGDGGTQDGLHADLLLFGGGGHIDPTHPDRAAVRPIDRSDVAKKRTRLPLRGDGF